MLPVPHTLAARAHTRHGHCRRRHRHLHRHRRHQRRQVPFPHILTSGKGKGSGTTGSLLLELLKWVATGGAWSDHTLPGLALAVIDPLTKIGVAHNARLIEAGRELKREVLAAIGEDGVLLVPSLPTPAPRHGPLPLLLRFADPGATGIWNVLELPATAVPLGLTASGLPIGVQVVGAPGMDHVCIAVASALAKSGLARWCPPVVRP